MVMPLLLSRSIVAGTGPEGPVSVGLGGDSVMFVDAVGDSDACELLNLVCGSICKGEQMPKAWASASVFRTSGG